MLRICAISFAKAGAGRSIQRCRDRAGQSLSVALPVRDWGSGLLGQSWDRGWKGVHGHKGACSIYKGGCSVYKGACVIYKGGCAIYKGGCAITWNAPIHECRL